MRILIVTCVMITTLCCTSKKEIVYSYESTLKKYLETTFNYTIPTNETIIVFLPLDGCNACLESSIALIEYSRSLVLITTSNLKDYNKYKLGTLIPDNQKELRDINNQYKKYEMGMTVPVILNFIDGECVYYKEMTINNHANIKEYFKWN